MKKNLLFIALFCFGLFSIANSVAFDDNIANKLGFNQLKYGEKTIAVGQINVNVSDKITLSPDMAEFSITALTQGKTSRDASDLNAENMKKLTLFLKQQGISDKDLTTLSYYNYDRSIDKTSSSTQKEYENALTVKLPVDPKQFYNVVEILAKYNIHNLQQDESKTTNYTFTISEIGKDENSTQQKARQTYDALENELHAIKIDDITIIDYINNEAQPEVTTVKEYYVENTLKVRVTEFNRLGKIIAKAQELGMNVNNDMTYHVSDKAKNQAIAEHEKGLFSKLHEKASRLLTGQPYQIGVPTSITIDSNSYYPISRPLAKQGMLAAAADAEQINIQTPAEYELTLNMNGTFEITQSTMQ